MSDKKEITFDQFIELVKQMRHNQRRYHRFRKPEIKDRVDRLEIQVDEIISVKTSNQINLF